MGAFQSNEPVPVFSLSAPRYDDSTFMGRISHFRELVDWRTLGTTDDELNKVQCESCVSVHVIYLY